MVDIGISEIIELIKGTSSTNNFYLMITILTWTIVVIIVIFMVFLSKKDFQNIMYKFGRMEEATDNLKGIVPRIQSRIEKVQTKLANFGSSIAMIGKDVRSINKRTEKLESVMIDNRDIVDLKVELERVKNQIPALVAQSLKTRSKTEKNFKKNIGRRLNGIMFLYLNQILNNLRYEKDMNSLGMHFRNLDNFIEFANERGYWGEEMMDLVVRSLERIKNERLGEPEIASSFDAEKDRVTKITKKKKK